MANVAFIGLGVMGYPMAGHLLKKGGHDLTVYNRTFAKAEAWVAEHGAGRAVRTPAEAARDADFVFCCVGNDEDLRSVTLGENGGFSEMKADAIFIDNTTASANIARELSAAANAKGFHFIDAPVSGGQAGAENGMLTVMCGGDEQIFKRAEPVIASYARMVNCLNPPLTGLPCQCAVQPIELEPATECHDGAAANAGTAVASMSRNSRRRCFMSPIPRCE